MNNRSISLQNISLFCIVFSFFGVLNLVFAQEVTLKESVKASDYVQNVHHSVEGNSAEIKWNLRYEKLPFEGAFIVRYIKSNLTKLSSDVDWNYTAEFGPQTTAAELHKLPVNEKIKYSVGVKRKGASTEEILWYKSKTFKTERGWSLDSGLIMRVLMLLGSLAMFIYGMKVMSEGIQKAAGSRLRKILGSMTSNRLKGIFTGFLTTSIIQSSSATTVMVVSFVNAGLLNLKESIGVIMGANIGTTVTAWLVAYLGFSVSMSDYALPIFLLAIIFLFATNSKIKSWGEMLAGFALLFIGLELLKGGVPDLKGNVDSLAFLSDLVDHSTLSVILFVLIGTIVTVVVQSSSAAMAVTILLCERGIIPFEMAAGMVMGENIGTTITANIAAIVANVHAKRAARAHLIFNVFGVTWMVILFPFYLDFINFLIELNYPSPISDPSSRPIALALFHTIFNFLNVIALVWFIDFIANIVRRMVPSKEEGDEDFRLEYIAGGVLSTPELSLLEVKKELAKFGQMTNRMGHMFKELIYEKDKRKKKKILDRIKKYEEITDRLREEISDYLIKCSENVLSGDSQNKVKIYMAINSDLERIGDIFYQMSVVFQRKEEEKIWFTPEQRTNVKNMLMELDKAFDCMISNIAGPSNEVNFEQAKAHEQAIDDLRDRLRLENDAKIEEVDFNVKSNVVYTDLIFSCERIGDLVINVSNELNARKAN